jgi:hypothetical protein
MTIDRRNFASQLAICALAAAAGGGFPGGLPGARCAPTAVRVRQTLELRPSASAT